MGTKTVDVGQALKDAWELLKKEWKTLLIMAIVAGVIQWIPGFLARLMGDVAIFSFLLGLLGTVVGIFISLRWIVVLLRMVDGKEVKIEDLWEGWQDDTTMVVQYFIASILFGLMVAVGMVFLILPGVYLALMFGMFAFALVDERLSAMESLTRSKELTEGVRGKLFVFWLAVMGINLLGALALGIGLIVTVPVTMLAGVYVYRQLSGGSMAGGASAEPAMQTATPKVDMPKTEPEHQEPSEPSPMPEKNGEPQDMGVQPEGNAQPRPE